MLVFTRLFRGDSLGFRVILQKCRVGKRKTGFRARSMIFCFQFAKKKKKPELWKSSVNVQSADRLDRKTLQKNAGHIEWCVARLVEGGRRRVPRLLSTLDPNSLTDGRWKHVIRHFPTIGTLPQELRNSFSCWKLGSKFSPGVHFFSPKKGPQAVLLFNASGTFWTGVCRVQVLTLIRGLLCLCFTG